MGYDSEIKFMFPNGLRLRVAAMAASVAVIVPACGGSQESSGTSGPPPGAKRVDESRAGSIAGRVIFDGAAPENAPIDTSSDPACLREGQEHVKVETFVVSDGGLENVFVYVKDGLGGYYFDVPTEPVKLDQKGCRYRPHVFGVRVGQPVEISNSDPTLHNVHAMPAQNREFNLSQAVAGMKNRWTFKTPELMVPFKCNVHGWMQAYAGVLDHPYFAVTGTGGRFELKNLPAGTYTVEAWHEKLGTGTQSVTLADREAKQISFTFKAGTI
jgi:plastocyanin